MSKEKDLKFIKGFSKISITQLCKDLKIDRHNIIHGKSSEETTRKVAKELRKKIVKLLEE